MNRVVVKSQYIADLIEQFWRWFLTFHITLPICRREFDPDIGPRRFDLETSQYQLIRSKRPVNQWLGGIVSLVVNILKGTLLLLLGLFMGNVLLTIFAVVCTVFGRPPKPSSVIWCLSSKAVAMKIWLSALAVVVLLFTAEGIRRLLAGPQ
jgi:hypothetical protein